MKIVDGNALDALCAAARESSRRRMNRNLHDSFSEPCQRLLNAVEPDSYIRPHRHLTPPKPETFLAVRGRFAAILFDDGGEITHVSFLAPGDGAVLADIAPGAWHAIFALEPGSVFFEAKPGPYEPISDKDWAPWSPPEGSPQAGAYFEELRDRALRFGR
jgi:cupin fold WbuC family metalloprotein